MPSRQVVAYAIRQIRGLTPPVEVIAPQHGFLLKGDVMRHVMERLERLPVGIDLLPDELDERHLQSYAEVVGAVMSEASQELGGQESVDRIRQLPESHPLSEWVRIDEDEVRLVRHGIRALPALVEALSEEAGRMLRAKLRSVVLNGCSERRAPLPQMGADIEEQSEGAGPIY